MEIVDVVRIPSGIVSVNSPIRFQFSITGAAPSGFIFPFSNESLTANRIEFLSLHLFGLLFIPSLKTSVFYTGETVIPSWNNYDPDWMTMSGDTFGIKVGIYKTYFTPKGTYRWIDTGGQETRVVIWSIQEFDSSETTWFYGYDLDLSDSNPSTRVRYPDDVDNAAYNPAKMNFGGEFNYGDWPNVAGETFMPRPCMLAYDGTVYEYLDPLDYRKTLDGAVSEVTNISFGGNAMMEWNVIYTKRWEADGVYHFRCSNKKLDDEYECWCNYDRFNNKIPHFYTPIYTASKDSTGKMRSISGQANLTNDTVLNMTNAASANGNDWYIEVIADRLLIVDLITMLFKSTNSQESAGYGVCNTSAAVKTGTMDSNGMFWGSNNKTSGVKVFGMEHVWGNIWRRVAGLIYNVSSGYKIKITRGNKDTSAVEDYNETGDGYISINDAKLLGNSGTGIKEMKTTSFGRLPTTLGGTTATYECDTVVTTTSALNGYALCGSRMDSNLTVGLFSMAFSAVSTFQSPYYTAALSCKPSLKT